MKELQCERGLPKSKFPARSPRQLTLFQTTRKIGHASTKGHELNVKLGKAMISGSLSFNLLDNVEFGMFVESLSDYTYNLPSRGYMSGAIVPIMYNACNIGNLVSADAKAGGCALTTPYLNNSSSHFKSGL